MKDLSNSIIATLFIDCYLRLMCYKVVHQSAEVVAAIWCVKNHLLEVWVSGRKNILSGKKSLRKYAVYNFLISKLHPSNEVSYLLQNRQNRQKLENFNIVLEEMEKISRRDQLAVVVVAYHHICGKYLMNEVNFWW